MSAPEPRAARDPRLDVFRGLCLMMIFINHTPGTIYENFTTRNFGFSDAAEAFVLMSGIAAGLAYGKYFDRPAPFWEGVGHIWRRVWTLYQVHIVTTVIALGISAATMLWFDAPEAMRLHAIRFQWQKPLEFLIGIPLLTHQIGYANILPLYAVLLAFAPLTLWAGLRWPRVTMALSVVLWLAAAMIYFNMPNYPMDGGWFFNPFSWQVIFTVGLLSGMAIRRGGSFVPKRRWLIWLALAWVGFALVASLAKPVSDAFGHMLYLAAEYLHFHWIFISFDKTFLALPRLSHALALAYLLACWPLVRQLAAHRAAAPFALLGRNGLAVFGLGVVLCYAANGVKLVLPQSFALDTAIIGGGIGLMLLLAWSKEAWRRAEKRARLT
ncbi:OpgC protein [Gemmobacter nanjingensis]|jgi:hypothetical protein|uniref:OpgC protein n=1 Tax=Gemmobacter nanjingensis TaxID=488454 RepID=A0ABQ3FCN6_9RHOB|nr:OpgC domain-containing protein [Gemmobacter nanjingensis]GHC18375.1 OpgC protein [Gemmobacter nanjingensis]